LNLFRPREAPRPYGRNARNERNDRYDRRYERRDAREGPPNFFDIFR
jgi:hypothetical protein